MVKGLNIIGMDGNPIIIKKGNGGGSGGGSQPDDKIKRIIGTISEAIVFTFNGSEYFIPLIGLTPDFEIDYIDTTQVKMFIDDFGNIGIGIPVDTLDVEEFEDGLGIKEEAWGKYAHPVTVSLSFSKAPQGLSNEMFFNMDCTSTENFFSGFDSITSECMPWMTVHFVVPKSLRYIDRFHYIKTILFDDDSIQRIDESEAFRQSEAEWVYLPNSLRYIGDEAFIDNRSITLLYLPKSVEHLGSRVFSWCERLYEIIYGGTMSDWQKLISNSSPDWSYNSYLEEIYCTDGIISLHPDGPPV